jgi:hypothetical protein
LTSYGDTLTEIQTLHNNFRTDLAGNLSNSQESLASKFDKYIGQATTANEALQNVKTVCKYPSKFASWFTGKGGDCFGYDIPNLDPNKILKKKLGKKDVQGALRGVIQLIDPQEDVSKLEVKGKHKTFFYSRVEYQQI